MINLVLNSIRNRFFMQEIKLHNGAKVLLNNCNSKTQKSTVIMVG